MTISDSPLVSVVMAAFNEEGAIEDTLLSISNQTYPNLEILVVDDGSTDATREVVSGVARRDVRVRLIAELHRGLTAALRTGCAEARGAFIARHDAGDVSDSRRIELQLEHITHDPLRVLVSCTTRYLAPGGELMYDSTGEVDDHAVRSALLNEPVTRIRGLSHHGSAFFGRADYEAAGGYREQFLVAQDLDLWIRLAERGKVSFVPEVLYESVFRPAAISGEKRHLQVLASRFAVAIRDEPDRAEELLEQLAGALEAKSRDQRRNNARGWYFIGRCLQNRRDPAAADYLRSAVRERPLFWRARAALLMERLARRPRKEE
ncbi:MAG: glycosyltransferase [Acidobacteria bacterium]|nr:glycosyltransferase [Acidobacteriota bacterium]